MALLPLLFQTVGRPLFLPAHGRGSALPRPMRQLLRSPGGRWDLPELPELGGPLLAEGAVADSQRSAAAAMDVARCWYGVNGATGLLQAALLGLARPGEAVLMPRNSHQLQKRTRITKSVPFLASPKWWPTLFLLGNLRV